MATQYVPQVVAVCVAVQVNYSDIKPDKYYY